MSQPDERMAELRELFFESAQELLQALNDEALKLEKHPGDSEIVRCLRRIVHTLKGDAAACGYRELSEVAHELEDALALESAAAHATLAEVAFMAADLFAAMLAAYRKRSKLPSRDSLRKMVKKLAAEPGTKRGTKKKAAVSAQALGWTEYEKLAVQKAQEAGNYVYHVQAQIDPHCAMPIAGRQLVQNALAGLGEVLAAHPEVGSPAATKLVEFLLATSKTAEEVSAKCQIPTIVANVKADLLPGEIAQPTEAAAKRPAKFDAEEVVATPDASLLHEPQPAHEIHDGNAEPAPQTHATPAENILRVDAERIDSVLNLVGELIIGKSMLQQALNEFTKFYPKDVLRGKFSDAMAFQARVLNDLQRSVMKIRMVPVEQLFRRFPRMVRDVARQCGKDVELVVSGQDTDLDKSILDAIAEPLTHLVRNAIGHGLETEDERKRAGKSPEGTLRLSAYHQGNQVIVEVRDDGRGMDAQRIKAKAIELGMVTREDADRLTEAETFEFVFRPGFSTAEQVTEVSGRGVGMDVVQSVLHRLKGSIHIETQAGQGTTFRLKLPLTLAIIKALLFQVQERLYAIPLNSVVEIARTREAEVHQVDHCEVLQLRNQVLPLVRLGRPRASGPDLASSKLFVLVISVGERKFGLIVDGLEGEEELVIKALDDHAVSTDLVSGASILGDGRVVLILNLSAVVDHFARMRPSEAGAVSSGLLLSHADRARLGQAAGGQA
ncbi:MAG TPA: chemotaxis protein CheA [Terriglobales bacterium]|nr:chemotaxis protein CheA [Terriglobales bacterium]